MSHTGEEVLTFLEYPYRRSNRLFFLTECIRPSKAQIRLTGTLKRAGDEGFKLPRDRQVPYPRSTPGSPDYQLACLSW